MATCKNLEFTITSRIIVSDKTAERCMRLLEIWMDDNPDKLIECTTNDWGRHKMRICYPVQEEKADDPEPFPEWRAHVERFMAAEPEAKADDPEPFPEWDVIPVQEIPSYTGQIIFLEDYTLGQVIGVKYRYADEKEETMVFRVVPRNRSETDGLTLYRRIEDYGRLWRCWNRPTTTEERKAVKWK